MSHAVEGVEAPALLPQDVDAWGDAYGDAARMHGGGARDGEGR